VKILQNDEDTIIYCDPPYRNTKAYRQVFDVEKFDKWVLNNDKTIFISEYNSPFYELFNINKQCTMSANNNNKVIEKLYSNKNLNILGQQTLF
jgi:DNA adenine methylase